MARGARRAPHTSDVTVVEPDVIAGFRVTRTLARRGRVTLALGHQDETGVVVLKVRSGTDAIERTVREASALHSAAGPHVVRLLDAATTASESDGDRGCLVLERCHGGTLAELLRRRARLDAGEVVTLLAPVIATVARLHDAGLAHGAIGDDHIALSASGEPRLIGWGAATMFEANAAEVAREREPGVHADRRAVRALVSRVARLTDPELARARDQLWARIDACADEDLFEVCESELFDFAAAAPLRREDPVAPSDSLDAVRGRSDRDGRSPSARQLVPARGSEVDGSAGQVGDASAPSPVWSLVVGVLPDRVRELLDRHGLEATLPNGWRGVVDASRAHPFGDALARAARSWQSRSPRSRRTVVALAAAGLVVTVGVFGVPAGGAEPAPELSDAREVPGATATAHDDAGADSDAAAASVLDGDDPVAAASALVTARERCLAELSILCLDQVFQPGSAAMEHDRAAIRAIQSGGEATSAAWQHSSDVAAWVVVERLGGTALVRLGADNTAASLLLMKGEAGWRVREYLATSPD